jgi:FKBP-type peptidyl-prolyl cis-trans isomerase SlyD
MSIEKGSKVSIHYNLKIDGKTVDSSDGRDPLTFVHGEGEIIPGLEDELVGMSVGDKKSVTVAPENGYGEHRDEGVQTVPRQAFQDADSLSIGNIVAIQAPDGQAFQATITEIEGDSITLDLNHPLAGKTLNFDVEIVNVEDAPSKIIKPNS